MRQGATIDVFQLRAEWYSMGDTAGRNVVPAGHVRQKMRRRIAFDGWICCNDEFFDLLVGQTFFEGLQPQLFRTDAIER